MYKLTAAHRTLPLGTLINVHCPETDRWVTVKVNDRGPFIRGRVLDLSYGAAKKLGIAAMGLAKVRIYLVPNQQVVALDPGDDGRRFIVQVGSFEDASNARRLKRKLSRDFKNVKLETFGKYTRVIVGPFDRESEAVEIAKRLQRMNYPAMVREKQPGV